MSVPSFSSFQPTPSKDTAEQKTHKSKKRKQKDSAHSDTRIRDPEPATPKDVRDGTRFPHVTSTSSPWINDFKGDPLNLQYGGLHTRAVPKYHLVGYGRIVGLSKELRLLKVDQKPEVSSRRFGKSPAITSSRFKQSVRDPNHRIWVTDSKASVTSSKSPIEFIPIRSGGKLQSNVQPLYRELQPGDSDSDSIYSSSDSDAGSKSILLTPEQIVIKDLEAKLSRDPSSVKTWFALLDHSVLSTRTSSKGTRNTQATIAISILQRALKAHPANGVSTPLLSSYLSWGEDLWDSAKLTSEWESALSRVTNEVIWLEWLNWRLRESRATALATVNVAGQRCLSSLKSEHLKLLAFWRIFLALHEAGYMEQGTALMQAQCELVLFKPISLEKWPFTDQLDALEEFWDAELPRIGEEGALGWKNRDNISRKAANNPRRPEIAANTLITRTSRHPDPYTCWMLDERISETRMPTRRDDDEADDPYGTILFADIRPLMMDLTRPESKGLLKRVWLSSLGLYVPGLFHFLLQASGKPYEVIGDSWSRTQLRRHSFFESLYSSTSVKPPGDAQAGVIIGPELIHGSSFGPIKEWSYGLLDPLEGVDKTERFRLWESRDVEGVDVPTVRTVFTQLKDPSDVHWDRLELAFEAALDVKHAIAKSQNQLKQLHGSLAHWHIHAQLELLRGKRSTSKKVYENVLSDRRDPETLALWASYARMQWLNDLPEEVIALVCRASGAAQQDTYSGLDVLRAKRHFDELLIQEPPASTAVTRAAIRLQSLLEMVTGGADSALSFLDSYLLKLNSRVHTEDGDEEYVFFECLFLINHYIIQLRNPYPRSRLRERAAEAVERYPNNTFFLALFLECERGEGVWGRVRNLIGDVQPVKADGRSVLSPIPKSTGRKVWEVWVITRWLNVNQFENEASRIRKLFSTWEEDASARGSPLFWRLWIEFELRLKLLGRAKKLLIRATAQCPLDKELYLLAFGGLRSMFRSHELNGWVDLMIERGVRLRRDLEPYLVNWTEVDSDVGVDEVLDEVEFQAAEYRRRLPYH